MILIFIVCLILAIFGTWLLLNMRGDDVMGAGPFFIMTLIGWIGVLGCAFVWIVRAVAS